MDSIVTEENIHRASGMFWEQMLAMRLEPICLDRALEQKCIGLEHVVAHCDLSGVWSGRIEVRLSRGLALEATAAMLMQPAETVLAEDMLDAGKEIANMIAGTLKSALPRPCTMTVPGAVIERGDYCMLRDDEDSVTVFFGHASGELMVRACREPGEQLSTNSEIEAMALIAA